MDFIPKTLRDLLTTLQAAQYKFQSFSSYLQNPQQRGILLRHDIDDLPDNALNLACLENQLGVQGTYYFRAGRNVFKTEIIRKIADYGHEIGYHYEEMDICRGDRQKAIRLFEENLARFRKLYPVKTLCMHGSPRSRFDNKSLWEEYDYRDYGIIGEPYLDIDFSKVLYLTDTGRCWNGHGCSIRDKVDTPFKYSFRSTFDIIRAVNHLPDKIMLTVHPQRWHEEWGLWARELVWQNCKNMGKWLLNVVKR